MYVRGTPRGFVWTIGVRRRVTTATACLHTSKQPSPSPSPSHPSAFALPRHSLLSIRSASPCHYHRQPSHPMNPALSHPLQPGIINPR